MRLYPRFPAQEKSGDKMSEDVKIGLIMGSQSDWPTMKPAADILGELSIAHEVKIVSAHRTPDRMYDYAKTARARGLKAAVEGATADRMATADISQVRDSPGGRRRDCEAVRAARGERKASCVMRC